MAKWADYGISAVRYNAANTHIDRVKVHVDDGTAIEAGKEISRAAVVQLLEQGKTFVTILKGSDGKWKLGAKISVFPVTVEYIKTAADKRAADNLENLPSF